VINLNFTIFI